MLGGKRINKKLLRWSLDIDEFGSLVKRKWIKGTENVLGDGPSRNPFDRDSARELRIPTGPVRRIVEKMFKNPEDLDNELEVFLERLNPDERPTKNREEGEGVSKEENQSKDAIDKTVSQKEPSTRRFGNKAK